jgi:hypothetical protein
MAGAFRLILEGYPHRLFVELESEPTDLPARCARLLARHEGVAPVVGVLDGDLLRAARVRFFAPAEQPPTGETLYWTHIFRLLRMWPRIREVGREFQFALHTAQGPADFQSQPRTGNYTTVTVMGGPRGTFNDFDWAVLAPHPNWMNEPEKLIEPAGAFD